MVGNITFRPMTTEEIAARDRAVQVEQDKARHQYALASALEAGPAAKPIPSPTKPRAAAKPKSGTQWPPRVKTPASKPRRGK